MNELVSSWIFRIGWILYCRSMIYNNLPVHGGGLWFSCQRPKLYVYTINLTVWKKATWPSTAYLCFKCMIFKKNIERQCIKKNIHNNIMVTKVTLDLNYGDILSISARYVRVGGWDEDKGNSEVFLKASLFKIVYCRK